MKKMIWLYCGKIGSGKSRYAERVTKDHPAVVLSVDELTLPLQDLLAGDVHDRVTDAVKAYLLNVARQAAHAGADVILDWGFWKKAERVKVRTKLEADGYPVKLVYFSVSDEQWAANLKDRNLRILKDGLSAYPVDEGLKAKCEALFEPPSSDEIDIIV